MSENEANTTLSLQRPPGCASLDGRQAQQVPSPVDRVRSAVTGTSAVGEEHAVHLKDSSAAIFMFASTTAVLAGLDVAGYRRYRDQLLADYGDPKDPIVIMLVEQLALAHLNCGQLFYKASSASSVECAQAYLAATTRLMAEFRRTALALPAYREAVQRLERCADPAESFQEKSTCDGELQEVEDSDEPSSSFRPYGQAANARRITGTARKSAASNAG